MVHTCGFQGETGIEGSKGNKVFFDLYTLYTLLVYISGTGRCNSKFGFFFLKQYH